MGKSPMLARTAGYCHVPSRRRIALSKMNESMLKPCGSGVPQHKSAIAAINPYLTSSDPFLLERYISKSLLRGP